VSAAGCVERLSVFSACLPGWTPARVISVAVSLGFSSVEWASGPGHAIEDPERGSELREQCERAGLHSAGVSVQDPEVTCANPSTAVSHLSLAMALGAPQVRLLAPQYRGGSLRREQQRARAGLDRLIELAAPAGVAVLIETSPATLAPAPELAAALVEQHPPERAGVLYDPGNMAIEGHLAPEMAVARLGPYLRHVHVKNIAWHRARNAWRWRHASLADGVLDWRSIVHWLAAGRYRGLFSIDHLGSEVSATRLRTETAFLSALMSEEFAGAEDRATAAEGQAAGYDPPTERASRSPVKSA
jgi:sugar phosphate isomerase/epimerase